MADFDCVSGCWRASNFVRFVSLDQAREIANRFKNSKKGKPQSSFGLGPVECSILRDGPKLKRLKAGFDALFDEVRCYTLNSQPGALPLVENSRLQLTTSLEDVVAKRQRVESQVEKKVVTSPRPRPGGSDKTPPPPLLDQWYQDWLEYGRKGMIGKVPEPFQIAASADQIPPLDVILEDTDGGKTLLHFYQWMQKRKK